MHVNRVQNLSVHVYTIHVHKFIVIILPFRWRLTHPSSAEPPFYVEKTLSISRGNKCMMNKLTLVDLSSKPTCTCIIKRDVKLVKYYYIVYIQASNTHVHIIPFVATHFLHSGGRNIWIYLRRSSQMSLPFSLFLQPVFNIVHVFMNYNTK